MRIFIIFSVFLFRLLLLLLLLLLVLLLLRRQIETRASNTK